MRRLLLLALLAPALAPAPALADGFQLDLGVPIGGARVHGFEDCAGTTCAPSAVELRIERAGATVASAGPALEPYLFTSLQPGDVVRILRDGVERVAIPYDAQPSVDDASCTMVGGTTLAGTFRRGDPGTRTIGSPGYGLSVDDHTYLRVALSNTPSPGMTDAAITTVGERWIATFPRPLAADERVLVGNAYTLDTAVGHASISDGRWQPVCEAPPPLPPAPVATGGYRDKPAPPCSVGELRANPEFGAALRTAVGSLRLKRVRRGRAALENLVVCARGLVSASIRTTGRRPAIVARGIRSTSRTRVTLYLTRTQRAVRLAGRRRVAVKLVLRFRDSAGDTVTWTRRVTLR